MTFSPERWAIDISLLLNAAFGPDHFPIKVPTLAKDYSAQKYSDDPISLVQGDSLKNFDGALYRAPVPKKGWGIIYNSAISSRGRINFTLAHEFGHYLIHRDAYPDGIRCGDQDVVRWDSEYGQIEHQANVFAANLLMPLDDYRRQIDARSKVDLNMLSLMAERYDVSLIAAILRWLKYTDRRAVLVVSKEGFILWSRASNAARKSGAFFRTSAGPIEVPATSLVARRDGLVDGKTGINMAAGTWLREEAREMTVFADQYNFIVTLLLLSNEIRYDRFESDLEQDTYERFLSRG
jgi:hypothetical protein